MTQLQKLVFGLLLTLVALNSNSQISVTATAGTTGPSPYTTLKAAFDAINAGTHQGNISVSVTGNTTETASATLNRSGSGGALYTGVLVKPATGVTATITGSVAGGLISLNGAANVVIDGSNAASGTTKDLTISNTNTAGAAVRLIDGATNNGVKNCILRGVSSITSSGVVFISTAATPATTGNNNNLIENNDITAGATNPLIGIYNSGTSGRPNTGNVIRGNRISNFSRYGFCDGDGTTGFSNNTLFEGNEIFQTSARTTALTGIMINNVDGVTNMVISKNLIRDLTTTATGTNVGIDLFDAASVVVVNNMIALNNATGSSVRGIAQETGAGSLIRIYYNTVLIYGSTTGTSASFAFLKNYESTGDDIRNNLFINTRTTSGTGTQYAFLHTDIGTFSSNYNNLFTSSSAQHFIAGNDAGNYASLAAWQTAATQDANSISVQPTFTSNTDLHLTTANSLIDNKGTPITGVTIDFDNQSRSATTPDMGADEFTAPPPVANDLAITSITSPLANATLPLGATVTVQAVLNNLGATTQTNAQVLLTITGPGGYNFTNTQTVASITSGSSQNVNFPASTAFATAGNYIITVTSLLSDNNAANNSQTLNFSVRAALTGSYTVGTGGDYTSLTNPGGIFADLNAVGATGNITLNITSDLANESGTISLNPIVGGHSVLIKPSGAARTITGTNSAPTIIRLNGADNVTIDGSLSGGTDRSLTIINPNTGSGTTVIWIASQGAGAGATNNTVKNCIIRGGTKGTGTSAATVITTFAIFAGNATGAAAGPDNDNLTIENNLIQRAAIGVQVFGDATGAVDNLIIRNNVLGDATADANSIGRTGMTLGAATNAIISGNTIQNVNISDQGNASGIILSTNFLNSTVSRNRITTVRYSGTGGFGGRGIDVSTASATSNLTIANNMISDIRGDGWNSLTSDAIVGIRLLNTTALGGINLYYNSVHLGSGSFAGNTSGTLSAALFVGANATNIDIRNNTFSTNLVNTVAAGAKTYAIYSAAPNTAFSNINYNNYFAGGTQGVAGFLGSDRADLAAIQSGFGSNTNSKNAQPVFTSATDLHITAGSNAALEDQGTPIGGIAVDFDGDARSATTPDIGADEVTAVCIPVVITTQPVAVSACSGTASSLSVTATGTNPSYQWRKGGTNISGATGATLSFATLVAGDAGTYDVVVTNACGTVTSAAVNITVQSAPTITTQPTNQTACPGSSVSFNVAANGTNLTYQWRKGSVNIPGATSPTYTIASVTASDAGNYDVVVSGTCSPVVTSASVSLTISSATTISTQPTNQTGCLGGTATFSVVASGGGLTYQWRKDGANITGATTNTLTLTGITAADAGTYDVVIGSTCGASITSSTATLSIGIATTITTQPTAQTVCAGSPVTFSVMANGGGTLTYQWRRGGVNIAGATSATYTIASANAGAAGSYDVIVTGSCGTATSNAVTLTVNPSPVASFTSASAGTCGSLAINFTNTSSGATIASSSWNFGDGNQSTQTNPTHTYTAAGNYNVTLTVTTASGCSNQVTQPVNVSVTAANAWTGTVSNSWHNAANWCGGIPTVASDITIPAGVPNMPTITAVADIRNLTIGTGASVTVATGGRLNIHGNFINNGTFTASNGTVAFQGSANQSVASMNVGTVVLNGSGGVTLTGSMTANTLTLTNGNLTIGNHALNLSSSSTGSVASHVITNGTGAVTVSNINLVPIMIPVGPTATSFNPVTITNGGGRNYTIRVATGISPNAITNNARAINRTWTITPNSAPGVLVNISLQYADADANGSSTPTAAMEAGVHNGTSWAFATPAGGVMPTGTAAARIVSLNMSQFGPTVIANPGGFSYPTAAPSVSTSDVSATLMPNRVEASTILRVNALRPAAVNWIIVDGKGKQVWQMNSRLTTGLNDLRISVGHLASGAYHLVGYSSSGEAIRLRFVKL